MCRRFVPQQRPRVYKVVLFFLLQSEYLILASEFCANFQIVYHPEVYLFLVCSEPQDTMSCITQVLSSTCSLLHLANRRHKPEIQSIVEREPIIYSPAHCPSCHGLANATLLYQSPQVRLHSPWPF